MNRHSKKTVERWKRVVVWILPSALVLSLAAVVFAQVTIGRRADRVFSVEQAPVRNVALVLGCSPRLGSRDPNLYFEYRIDCAAALYKAGKVRRLLVSGDNSRKDYDEPTAMKEALVARGVPADRIVLDYAGFSTFESIVRAREVFGQRQLLIVSQPDHVMRALYIADARGVDAVGVAAREVSFPHDARTRTREALARVRTLLDLHLWFRSPKFLGPSVVIPEAD